MEWIKETAGLAAITILFSLLTLGLTASYIEEYNLFSAEPVTVSTTDKVGVKGLYTPPTYYVRVNYPNGEESPYLNRISKMQEKEIVVGDSIDGYSIHPSDFSTVRDFIFDSAFFLFGITIFGFIAFCCLVALLLSIPILDRMEKQTSYNRQAKRLKKRRKKGKKRRERNGWRIVGVVIFGFLFFIGRFLLNLFRKLLPFGKTETEAIIFDRDSHFTFRKYEDSSYELSVAFKDEAGRTYQVIKDVTRHTYHQYDIGDKLPITYRNANPYDVFIRGTSFQDIFQAFMTWEALVYLIMMAVTLFVGWIFFKERRKEWELSRKTKI